MSIALLNGQTADADALRALAVVNYGHFTAMQVRGRAVQGLDFHVARLQRATRELFDFELTRERIVDELRTALHAGPADASLRLTVFARAFDYRQPLRPVAPDVLITLGPAAADDKPALRVKSYPFLRSQPHLKHVGTFPLFHYRRQALREGYDDALFVGPDGTISEGSIWNLGFWDGETVVWPEAPALRGTCEQLLQAGLAEQGVPQRIRPVSLAEAGGFRAAFAANASGLQALLGIDEAGYAPDPAFMAQLKAALASRPWEIPA
ncbi:aminotransferase class IV family protein [Pseudoxanthomonas beigongshangi]